jgi:hypothetical protein
MLEVKRELRLSRQIGQPVTPRGSGNPAEVDVLAQTVEDDLDTPRLAGTPACGGDVDRAIVHCR